MIFIDNFFKGRIVNENLYSLKTETCKSVEVLHIWNKGWICEMQIQKINFVNSIAETMQLLLDPLFVLFNKHKSILTGELYYRNSFEILCIVYIHIYKCI